MRCGDADAFDLGECDDGEDILHSISGEVTTDVMVFVTFELPSYFATLCFTGGESCNEKKNKQINIKGLPFCLLKSLQIKFN